MDRKHLWARLEKGGWAEKALAGVVTEQLADASPTAIGLLADAARKRALEGEPNDAARLAALALQHAPPVPAAVEEEEAAATTTRQTIRWNRWRLVALLRLHPTTKTLLKALTADDRKAIQAPSLPLDAEALMGLIDDPEQMSGAIAEASSHDVTQLAETLFVLSGVVHKLLARSKHHIVTVVARSGLELVETARTPHDAARVAVDELRHELGAALVTSLGSLEDGDEVRTDSLDWLLRSKGGEPRVMHLGASVERLVERDMTEVVARLRKKASKSGGFRRALLWMGQIVLPGEVFIDLCKEYDHPLGIVDVLLDREDVDEAAKVAAVAIEADHGAWLVAKRFDELGRTDLAMNMLRAVVDETVSTDLEHWLAERLTSLGEQKEALAIYRNRFVKRPALPQFQALRARVKGKAWSKLRAELIRELTERRLHRPLMDIANEEQDTDLLLAILPELDHDQAEHAENVLRSWSDGTEGPTPKVSAALAELEHRRERRSVTAPEVVAAEPVPETVRHKKFGEGKVVGWSGEGDQRKLEIEFESAGKKVLLARFVEILT
jgi:PcrA/UvrD tudor domain